ncbi:uncharacterized protein LOC117602131 [Osmia lignaria lignaria]|uniref:uncharacterized protein LOC117602131 n=1 Tax=Osmia lignaria lignaria TaxID=1437193 RepID=UPI001479722D|nr:histamine H1 receptor-like [Osmia lignaria]XP_034175619.1 histamine H1 receptor-like [Osmia lignaria]
MVGDSPDIVEEGSISDLGDLEGWWDNQGIVAWSFVLFGCFFLNSILLLAFLIRPSLRTISNRFVMNLTVSNLLVCATMIPLLIMDAASTAPIVDSTSIGSICTISEGAVAIVTTSSVLSVLLIAVDQYFAVVDPLRYRARVDKLKAGILIMSIWFISIVFGFLAFFNPNPQSLWLSCCSRNNNFLVNITSLSFDNETREINVTELPQVLNTSDNGNSMLDTLMDNSTITYGFIYAIVYSILVYFIPFVAICWIYVSIYVAAHRNSVRTRKSGSRPILSSASFTEEQNGPSRVQRLQTDTIEDFRKLPKISSLSSIDETSETVQPPGQGSRRRSFSSALEIEISSPPMDDQPSSGIVFTVGLQPFQVSPRCSKHSEPTDDQLSDSASQKNDPQVEEETEKSWNSSFVIDQTADSEDELPPECFDKKLSLENTSNDDKQDDLAATGHLQPETDSKTQRPADSGILKNFSEVKPHRRLSTTFVDIEPNLPDNSTVVSNKTDKDTGTGGGATESSSCLLTPIVTITPATNKNEGLQRVASVRSTSSYINSLKDRISNGSIFRHREETRAARISAVVIVMGLICWSPYVVLLLTKNLPRSTGQHLPHKYDVLASSFFILAAYISPLLFGYRSKRVKRELRRFFCFRKELSYKNNRSLMAKKVLKRRHSSTLSHFEMDHKYNIFNCVYGRNRWPKEKVQFVQVPDTALAVETCRSSFSSGASTQISSTSTEEC